jgi:hypothetical protein
MPFIGNQPALSYTSFAKQDFTTSATTSYALSQPVANENEIALFINFVRQEPTTAYTASGTSLTLTSATSASDDMYAIFLGKAVQTVNPPNGSVDSSKINYPLTTFSSTGIDDNATSTAITIDSSENVGIGTSSPTVPSATGGSTGLHLHNSATNGASVIHLTNGDTGSGVNDGAVLELWSDENVYLWNYENTNTIFATNNAERMRIDSSGNVGVRSSGATTPTYDFNTLGEGLFLRYWDASGARHADLVAIGNTPAGATQDMRFFTNSGAAPGTATERMRIDSSGNVLINTTSALGSGYLNIEGQGKTFCAVMDSDTGSGGFIGFFASGGAVGNINTNGTTTSYVTSSDYRLKENVNYNFDATTRLKQLKPARFNFITNPNKTVDGFLAHEVSEIVPEAIHGIKDETQILQKVVVNSNNRVIAQNIEQADWEAGKISNAEGTSQYPVDSTWEASKVVPVYQGIDQSKLTPILTKALQEAIDKIEQLEARITALENN